MQLLILTTLTMIAFAANSVFARLALGDGAIDAASYSAVRLGAGALVLTVLASNFSLPHTSGLRAEIKSKAVMKTGGNWPSAVSLLVYIVGFSFAYLALDTGVGALILFAVVQATMIGWGIFKGSRPVLLEWIGLIIAFAAFVYLISPGLSAPPLLGSILMIAAGIGWGAYSLRGRGAADPLLDTAGNFIRASLAMFVVFIVIALASYSFGLIDWSPKLTGYGAVLALMSGAVTSGLGYALWYYCLRQLVPSKAAIVQLSVPAIATFGGVLFAGETLTTRLLVCSILILGGVAVAISAKPKTN